MLSPMVQRYLFESKSQHGRYPNLHGGCCLQWLKDTNLRNKSQQDAIVFLNDIALYVQ